MAAPILVTGAAGRIGAIRRTVTDLLLAQGNRVRAMVRKEDARSQALRNMGAEIVIGDLPLDDFEEIQVEPWREGLLQRGLLVHLVNHLATKFTELERVA